MSDITKVPALTSGDRPETGPMQFGDDWPGVFFRGDEALLCAMTLQNVLENIPDAPLLVRAMVEGLRDTMRSCSVGNTGWPPGDR